MEEEIAYQAKVLKDLEDAEVVQSASPSNIAQELVKGAFLTVLSLDVQMIVVLPVIEVLHHMLRVTQRLEDLGLSELGVSIPGSLERLLALLHSINLSFCRAL